MPKPLSVSVGNAVIDNGDDTVDGRYYDLHGFERLLELDYHT